MNALIKNFIAQHLAQHVQNASALWIWIGRAPKSFAGVFINGADHANRVVTLIALGHASVVKHGIKISIWSITLLHPQRVAICGPSFIEPNVRPTFARDEIAGPLMAQLVADQTIQVLFLCGRLAQNG